MKKKYRDRYGRFAKRGQPLKPTQPRVKGRYVSRPAPLRLGISRQGKRYWIKPRRLSKNRDTGIRDKREKTSPGKPRQFIGGGQKPRPIGVSEDAIQREEERQEVEKDTVEKLRSGSSTYGYKLDDFLARTDHPDGYSYVTYHVFYVMKYKGRNIGQVTTTRGRQYNTVEDLREGVEDELQEINEDEESDIYITEERSYLYTIVAVIPKSGAERVPGSVYPEDYSPKERPGTREFEIEEGKAKAKRFWEQGKLEP